MAECSLGIVVITNDGERLHFAISSTIQSVPCLVEMADALVQQHALTTSTHTEETNAGSGTS